MVEQVDRDFAADIWRDYVAKIGECMVEKSMRQGTLDEGLPTLVKGFRIAAEARGMAEIERLREALREIASVSNVKTPHGPKHFVSRYLINGLAIAALKGNQ